ncbi:hypothetical protein BDZ45DRAFT_689426 [Acephala macrosclerotiorum]|nr:hypothetical protein BDZ45DRAFT_689426 [Acephala macrosclerotiorum]
MPTYSMQASAQEKSTGDLAEGDNGGRELPSIYYMPMYFAGSDTYPKIILNWLVPDDTLQIPKPINSEPKDRRFLRKMHNDTKAGFKARKDVRRDVENLTLSKGFWRVDWGGKGMLEIAAEVSDKKNDRILLRDILTEKVAKAKVLAQARRRLEEVQAILSRERTTKLERRGRR